MTSSRSDRPFSSAQRPERPSPRVVQAFFPGGRAPARWLPAPAAEPRAQAAVRPRPAKAGLPAQHASAPPPARVRAFALPADFPDSGVGRGPQALPPLLQRQMERFFGHDFSDVRVHVGLQATSIGALAFTLGSDIYFAPGQYRPHTRQGQQRLGHELAHVVQQREGRVASPLGNDVALVQDPALEDEAERMGAAVAAQSSAPGTPRRAPRASAPGCPARPAAQQANTDYKLIVGAYLHDEPYPEPLAGHSFVAVQGPDGERRAFGFSPANFGSYDPHRDLDQLTRGVEGVVHDDAGAFEKRGVRTRAFAIDASQARAAMARIHEYQSGRYRFSLAQRQCSAFALDVLRAARIDALGEPRARQPRELYREL